MPVVDTEVLFRLNPTDPGHQECVAFLKGAQGLIAPDTAVLEFQAVLRGRGRSPEQVRRALLALHEALKRNRVAEAKSIDTLLLALHSELEEAYGLSYFDSLIAASALALDGQVVSDDDSFDKVPGLRRILLSRTRGHTSPESA